MARRTNPGDVANLFIRCLLSDAGLQLGSFNKKDWENTLRYFDYKCAYTGEPLTENTAVMDHLIPHNKTSVGLHLYGNIIPCTAQANATKRHLTLEEFFNSNQPVLSHLSPDEKTSKLNKIRSFVGESKYEEKVARIQDLTTYCNAQYEMIKKLCEINKEYIANSIGEPVIEDIEDENVPISVDQLITSALTDQNTLNTTCVPKLFGKNVEDIKIQDLAKEAFTLLLERAKNSSYHQNLLAQVQDSNYCKEHLLLDFPAIKKVIDSNKVREERVLFGRSRYYASPYGNNEYLLTSEWYNPEANNVTKKRQKPKLIDWIKSKLLVDNVSTN